MEILVQMMGVVMFLWAVCVGGMLIVYGLLQLRRANRK